MLPAWATRRSEPRKASPLSLSTVRWQSWTNTSAAGAANRRAARMLFIRPGLYQRVPRGPSTNTMSQGAVRTSAGSESGLRRAGHLRYSLRQEWAWASETVQGMLDEWLSEIASGRSPRQTEIAKNWGVAGGTFQRNLKKYVAAYSKGLPGSAAFRQIALEADDAGFLGRAGTRDELDGEHAGFARPHGPAGHRVSLVGQWV